VAHTFSYCDHCERQVVICGKCGNNTCSGGYGEVIGPEPGTLMTCDACPSAYELDKLPVFITAPDDFEALPLADLQEKIENAKARRTKNI
jgi:hypothetical protein